MREEKYFQIKDQLKYPKKEIVQRFFSHFFFHWEKKNVAQTQVEEWQIRMIITRAMVRKKGRENITSCIRNKWEWDGERNG